MITYNNIKAFIQGNYRLILSKLNHNQVSQYLGLSDTMKEQVAYRMDVCGDSCKTKCKYCGCSTPGKWFASKSCGGGKYPDLMNEQDWNKYKKENNI